MFRAVIGTHPKPFLLTFPHAI